MEYNLWRNIKNKRFYHVLSIALDCTNEREGRTVVNYTRDGNFYSRDLEEFFIKFEKTKFSIEMNELGDAEVYPFLAKLNDDYLKLYEDEFTKSK